MRVCVCAHAHARAHMCVLFVLELREFVLYFRACSLPIYRAAFAFRSTFCSRQELKDINPCWRKSMSECLGVVWCMQCKYVKRREELVSFAFS